MNVKMKTRDRQRKEHYARLVIAFRQELTLCELVRRSIKGDQTALSDFQQKIHYAPDDMKFRLITYISNL